MRTNRETAQCLLLVGIVLAARSASAEPMGTAFTYQGQLRQEGALVESACDFEFSLWDAESGGSQIPPTLPVTVPADEMNDGLFTVTLDFGAGAFDGDARWLDIAVSCSPSDPFVTLGRQELTPAPNASYASTAGGAETAATTPWTGLSGVPAGFDDDVDNDLLAQTACVDGEVLKWSGAGGDWTCAEDAAGGDSLWRPIGSNIYYHGGNVGIGTVAPTAKLTVEEGSGTVTSIDIINPWWNGDPQIRFRQAGDPLFSLGVDGSDGDKFKIGTTSPETDTRMTIGSNGNVGIGTTNPDKALQVSGTGDSGSFTHTNWQGEFGKGGAGRVVIGSYEDQPAIQGHGTGTSFRLLLNPTGGNVGIGTDTPGRRLHVVDTGQNADMMLESTHGESSDRARLWMKTGERLWILENDGGLNAFKIRDQTAGDDRLVIDYDGNVGIGTTGPSQKLDIAGNLKFSFENPRILGGTGVRPFNIYENSNSTDSRSWIEFWGDHPAGDRDGELTLAGTYVDLRYGSTTSATGHVGLRLDDTGNVGIGTTDPAYPLDVRSSAIVAINGQTSVFNGMGVRGWHTAGSGNGYGVYGRTSSPQGIGVYGQATGGGRAGVFQGDVVVNGTTTTEILQITGADLAEKFPVSEEVQPGLVMQIDPDHPGKLRLARGAYNRRVAGVVSGANGLSVGVVLGNLPGQEDAPPIAMSGRVWVHCDASNGAIVPGDLLTTSDTAGHAMKVIDYGKAQGAIIGKAMTPLSEGKGLVLVLVSLQ